ncbi:PREDICTED: flocculation protein FLO11-like [Ipomoea nil]|uniref:flocculation protein FLO11-like n=1 Tax=Ipomoea nil TaxID=35883 RepID=UPI0009013714|nr:PREDICTED: flocculation protein FLO11-like [Ipomoea nil]
MHRYPHPAPSVGTTRTTSWSSKGTTLSISEVGSTKGSSSTITPSRHVSSPKGFVGSSPISSYSPKSKQSPAPKRFTLEVIIPPKSSISSSSANALSSSSWHAAVKAPTPVTHLQPPSHTARTTSILPPSIASKIIPSSSSSPTSLPAPSSNKSPVTSPQPPTNIAPIPPNSNSACAMPITPTLFLASLLSLSITVTLLYSNYLLFIIN